MRFIKSIGYIIVYKIWFYKNPTFKRNNCLEYLIAACYTNYVASYWSYCI